MKLRIVVVALPLLLAACFSPKRPEIATIDATRPFNQAMEVVIKKDPFLAINLRPGFHRDRDGATESYTVSPNEEGSVSVDHLVMLSRQWCSANGGRMESFSEVPVLQRGVGNVIQLAQNEPVVGKGQNLVCYRGREVIAEAAIGRTSYFLNAVQFRQAMREAGASIVEMQRR